MSAPPTPVSHTEKAYFAGGTLSWSGTYGLGESIIVVVSANGFGAPTLTANGTSITATVGYNNATSEYVAIFIKVASPTDNFGTVSFVASASAFKMAGACAGATGVVSVGAEAHTGANSTAASVTSAGSATNEIIVFGICCDNGGVSGAISGLTGISADNNQTEANGMPICIGHASGTGSNVTGSATAPSANNGAIAVRLVGTSGSNIDYAPGGATIATTAGTPSVNVSSSAVETPAGVSLHATMGTPIVTGITLTELPAGATIHTSNGTPVITGPTVGPLDNSVTKFRNGQDVNWAGFGDSTMASIEDTGTPPLGWFGVWGMYLAICYDYTLILNTAGWDGTHFLYNTQYTLRTGTRGTLNLWNGGVGATGINDHQMTYLGGGLVTNANGGVLDAIMICTGLNDMDLYARTTTQFVSDMQGFITGIQAVVTAPTTTPIIILTEDVAYDASTAINPGFAAVLAAYGVTAGTSPVLMNPSLQKTTATGNVWALDTQAAFSYTYSTPALMFDGYHPNHTGYGLWGTFVTDTLTPGSRPVLVTAGGGATIATSPGTPVVTAPYTVTPAGKSTTAVGGQPGVIAPYTDTPGGALITATGQQAEVDKGQTIHPIDTTIGSTPGTPVLVITHNIVESPGGATVATARGIPGVTAPYTVTPGSAIIHATGGAAFVPSHDVDAEPGGNQIYATGGTPKLVTTKTNAIWFLGVQGSFVGQRIITAADWVKRLGAGSWQDTIWNVENGYAITRASLQTAQINFLLNDVEFIFGQLGDRHS